MTPEQLRAFDFVRDRLTGTGYAPTVVEMQQHLGLASKSSVHRLVSSLVERGMLAREQNKERGLSLIGEPDLRRASLDAIKAELARRGETLGGMRRRENLAYGRKPSCRVDSCGVAVERGHVMCRTHWFAVPYDLREKLMSAYSAARRTRSDEDARAYQDLLTEAADLAERGAS